MKRFFSLFFIALACSGFAVQDIIGFWRSVNDDGVTDSIFAIYEYEGMRYGRIIATCDHEGKVNDSIYKPTKRASGLKGDPYYSGLDFIWYLQDTGASYMGTIMDPRSGKTYNAELKVKDDALKVKGSLFVFSQTRTWLPVTKADLPKGFKLPKLKSLVPHIPAQ